MFLRVDSTGNIVHCDKETTRRMWRDYLIGERLLRWKKEFIEFQLKMTNRNWKKVRDCLAKHNIECAEEDAKAIVRDIVVSIKDYNFTNYNRYLEYDDRNGGCDKLELIMSRDYLEHNYNNERHSLDELFQVERYCRMRAVDWKTSHLSIKEVIPIISVLFYDGIAFLYDQ